MQRSPERPFCLEDYLPFLKTLAESEDESVLVGGLAVSAWAEFLAKLRSEPAPGYDAKRDAERLLLHLEDPDAAPFPLPERELGNLRDTLRVHLG